MIRLFHYFSLAGMTSNLVGLATLIVRTHNNFMPAYWSLIGLSIVITSITVLVTLSAGNHGASIPLPVFFSSLTILISILLGGGLAWL